MHSWNDVSINNWKRIKAICGDDTLSPTEKNLATLAVICDCEEDEIYTLTVQEVQGLLKQMDWLDRFEFNQDFKGKYIKLGKDRFVLNPDLQQMIITQYTDFQTLWHKKDRENYMGLILACFLIPEGHKYGEGYDALALARRFEDELSIVVWNEVVFFSLRDWLISTKATIIYYTWKLKRMTRKATNPQARKMLEGKIQELRQTMAMYGFAS